MFCPVSPFIKSPFASWDFLPLNVYLKQLCHHQYCLRAYIHLFLIQGKMAKTSLTTIMVLFFLMEMVTKETHQIPVQLRPFPVYPGWQVQTYNPLVFMQIAFTWQEWFPLHSSISEKQSIHFCTLSFFVTYSRSIPLIIINFKTNVSLLGLHKLDIAKLYFSSNSLIYQPDCSETSQV